jgi:hypothetical protein
MTFDAWKCVVSWTFHNHLWKTVERTVEVRTCESLHAPPVSYSRLFGPERAHPEVDGDATDEAMTAARLRITTP